MNKPGATTETNPAAKPGSHDAQRESLLDRLRANRGIKAMTGAAVLSATLWLAGCGNSDAEAGSEAQYHPNTDTARSAPENPGTSATDNPEAQEIVEIDQEKRETSSPAENSDGNTSAESRRPDVSPCDGSEALEEVVRHTRPDQFPESGGSWRGVIAADSDNINPGPEYCFEDYAFGFLQPETEEGDFNWVVVARSDWETEIFPTELKCSDGDAINLTEPPEVEEMLCTTSQEDQGSSEDNSGDSDTEGDTDSSDDIEEASLSQAVEDYYRAAGAEEWAYTYDHLDSQAQSMFTEEEWSQKNQWFWDSNPTVYHILSINSDSASEEPLAEVEVRITGEDGSSWTRTTYFILEDGEWKHRLSEAESDLFMPDATFEEFVEAQTGTSSDGGAAGVCDGISGCEPVNSADVDGDGSLDEIALVGEPDEYSGGTEWITIRVLLADGTTLTRDSEFEFWSPPVYHGATDFGRVPGEELVVRAMSGAHTRFYRVLTYRDGELVELPYPDGDMSGGDPSMWPIDAAASVYMGVECDHSDSTVVLRSVSSVGPPSEDSTFEGEETRWVLEGNQWRMVDSRTLEYPDAASAFEIAGWFCGDLPRGYE